MSVSINFPAFFARISLRSVFRKGCRASRSPAGTRRYTAQTPTSQRRASSSSTATARLPGPHGSRVPPAGTPTLASRAPPDPPAPRPSQHTADPPSPTHAPRHRRPLSPDPPARSAPRGPWGPGAAPPPSGSAAFPWSLPSRRLPALPDGLRPPGRPRPPSPCRRRRCGTPRCGAAPGRSCAAWGTSWLRAAGGQRPGRGFGRFGGWGGGGRGGGEEEGGGGGEGLGDNSGARRRSSGSRSHSALPAPRLRPAGGGHGEWGRAAEAEAAGAELAEAASRAIWRRGLMSAEDVAAAGGGGAGKGRGREEPRGDGRRRRRWREGRCAALWSAPRSAAISGAGSGRPAGDGAERSWSPRRGFGGLSGFGL